MEIPDDSSIVTYERELAKASDDKKAEILYAIRKLYGLQDLPGSIVIFPTKSQGLKFYITAAGVYYLTQQKIKDEEISVPKFEYNGGKPVLITVVCKVTTMDGRTVQDIACVDCVPGPLSDQVKKAATQASVRARKKAVGIGILAETDMENMKEEK